MSGDYSRHRFDPHNHYAGVKMQQGRVQLDADWNEWTDVIDRRQRAQTVDTFDVFSTTGIDGVAVVSPQTPDAFLIEVSGGSFTIGPGRMYVDGLLAENFGHKEGPQTFDAVLAELHGQNPIAWNRQPYHPDPAALPNGGPHLAYLEVWQREVTHLQRPDLVEKAIGVDTTTRTQTGWQVRLLEKIGAGISCTSPDADLGKDWKAIIAPSAGRLSSRDIEVSTDEEPCELPASGGYRGLENQLYRIEIHDGGSVGTATFKWSRDNASVAASVVEVVSNTDLKLASLGRDAVLRFNTGDWVEIIDDRRELSGKGGKPDRRVGEMRKITVDDAKQTISFSPALPTDLIPSGTGGDTLKKRHLRVIRWDQRGKVLDDDDNVIADLDKTGSQGVIPVPDASVWVTLENGVQVQFSLDPGTGGFRCNDYWTVAARTADASVEILTKASPQGIHRHYARLALVTFPGNETDCREHWPPDCGGGCCNIVVEPGDSIQKAIDSLPAEGGCVCLKTGVHEIKTPLEIHASNIKFHGESPAATVRATGNLPYLLEIGHAERPVRGVEVLGIRFEATTRAEAAFLLYLNRCTEVRVARCALEVVKDVISAHLGIWMQDVRDVVVTDNHLQNLLYGIWVKDYHHRLIIKNNVVKGISVLVGPANSSFGKYGIRVENDFVAPCHIEHNQLTHFWVAIQLLGGAPCSHVADNHITRVGDNPGESVPTNIDELRTYLDNRYYAIDIAAEHCRVEGNDIDLSGSPWGGIRTMAKHTVITDNFLRSSSKPSPKTPVPASVYCVGLADKGNAADHSRISNNRLTGPQTGIVISRVHGVVVEDNFVDGMGAGWFGVRGDDCHVARVCGNRFEEVFFAAYHSAGEGNHVCDNQVSRCGMGISSVSENNLNVSRNTVSACLLTGIALEIVASATLIGNRVGNCGYVGPIPLGIGVFSEHLLVESEALVRIEGNGVLDTGIDPLTEAGTTLPAVGIMALCAACNVGHNHTDYSQNVLDVQREHRALMLIGPMGFHFKQETGDIEIMFGGAIVTDNHFRGPGRSCLVEFLFWPVTDNIDFRFERVTFSNNICDHRHRGAEDEKRTATVRLWGRQLIAMGNHIKADDRINTMSLGNLDQVSVMGNITTGGFIRVGTTTPAPLSAFNIRT